MDAPNILAQAESGTLGRGEQDLLVRFERQLPGFGGVYLSNGIVRVYMKNGTIPPGIVRNVLSNVYLSHQDADVREAMKNVATATVIPGQYSLSELIAIQKRIEASFSGWSGVGTNVMANRVVVAFPDSDALLSALGAVESAGVPAGALTGIVMPMAIAATVYYSDLVRPIRAGLGYVISNDTYEPHGIKWNGSFYSNVYYGALCSFGFNVHATSGDYFLTAGHCENEYRGVNGISGDTVFQPNRGSAPGGNNAVGQIVINPEWPYGAECPPNGLGGYYDFCTDADAALGQYSSLGGGERKVAVSTYSGVNGNAGDPAIKNWWGITRVLAPEYVDSTMHHYVHKSAMRTYTTTGPFVSDMIDVPTTLCWPSQHYSPCWYTKSLLWQNQTIIQADVFGGDSGGAVFTGDPGTGAPYAALGILVGRIGPNEANRLPLDPCATCRFIFSRWSAIESRMGRGTLNPKTTIP